MSNPKSILDLVLDHEANRAQQIYLTQPLGQGRVADYTWAQVLDQSRRGIREVAYGGRGENQHRFKLAGGLISIRECLPP